MSDNLRSNERICVLTWAYGISGDKESDAGSWRFAYSGIDGFMLELGRARDEWLASDAHEDHDYGDAPNWGDFISWCAPEILGRHNLRLLPDAGAERFSVHHDETFELPEERFLTITVVVRLPADVDRDDIDPSVIRQLVTDDETMWFGSAVGVTEAAIAGGADPTSWAYED